MNVPSPPSTHGPEYIHLVPLRITLRVRRASLVAPQKAIPNRFESRFLLHG